LAVKATVAPARVPPHEHPQPPARGRPGDLTASQSLGLVELGGQALSLQAVQRLQATAGNAAVAHLLARQDARQGPAHRPAPPHAPVTMGIAVPVQRLATLEVVQRDCGCGGSCGGCGQERTEEEHAPAEDRPTVQRLRQTAPPVVAPPVTVQRWNPLDWAKKLAEKAIGAIRSLGASAWNTAKSLGSAAWNTAKSMGSAAWSTAKSAGSGLWNTAKSLGSAAWSTAKSLGSAAWSTAKSAGSSLWNKTKSAGSGLWNTAKAAGAKAWSGAKALGSQAWSGAKALGSKAWSGAK
jgi:hypothetical protein